MREYKRRFLLVTIIIANAFLILVGRLWYLQIVRGDEFEKFSLDNRVRSIRIPAPRGRILDRRGREIVVNRPSFDIYILPEDIQNPDTLSSSLSPILGIEPNTIRSKIKTALQKSRFKPALLAKDINRDQLAFIEARKSSLPGVLIEVNHIRKYNQGTLGAAFLGYMGKINEDELKLYPDVRVDDVVGKSGIEKEWEVYLHGKDGYIQKLTDAFGREVKWSLFKEDLHRQDSVPGSDVVLSIDLDLQYAAEEALGDRRGAAVAVNVNSGEILALVSHPTFDPSDFIKGIDAAKWKYLLEDKSAPLTNRATQGVYPPGSVFKIVTAAAGLAEGVINSDTYFYCPGRYKFGKKTFKCWKGGGHGSLNLHQAIVESCDVYFYNVAERLGIDRLSRYIKRFGFGIPTGIELNEKVGISPSREWKVKTLKKPWYEGETIVTAIGQGYLSVTPLQIAIMTSALANGEKLIKPRVVREVISPDGKTLARYDRQETGNIGIEGTIINIIKDALEGVVNEPNGTGRAARLDGMVVAGKTGTAQVVSSSVSTNQEDYKDHAWFTSYAPAENPEIAVTVLIEHGGKGGAVAAPIVKQILEAYLKLKKEGSV